jgi:rRNA-processing protein FCF1
MQLDLFNEDSTEVIIPKEVISPLESNRRITSKAFEKEKETFASYVQSIQDQYECSWFEARKMFFKYRENQEPILIKRG